MKTCPFNEKIFLYMDDELSGDEISEVEKHLKDCSHCRENVNSLKKIEKFFHCAPPIPEDFTRKIMEKINEPSLLVRTLPALGLTILFIGIFFFTASPDPLPAVGNIILKFLEIIKALSLTQICKAFIEQNINFLASYTLILMSLTIYFILWKKKKPVPVKNFII